MSLLYPPSPWCDWSDVWRLATPLGSMSPTLSEQWCGFFCLPQEPDPLKCCETGPTVFCPYLRRLESLTVCRCHYKGSTFFSFILRPWVLVQPGFKPATSCSADWCSPNWANKVAVNLLLNYADVGGSYEPQSPSDFELHTLYFFISYSAFNYNLPNDALQIVSFWHSSLNDSRVDSVIITYSI